MEEKRNKSKKSKFWLGFGIYGGVLIILIVILCINVWKTMKVYEAAQPEHVVEEVVSGIMAGRTDKLSDISAGKFETKEEYLELFKNATIGKELTFRQSTESYDALSPAYDVLNGDNVVAVIKLKEVKSYTKLGILSYSDWEVDSVEPKFNEGSNDVKITLPDSYTVSVNGIVLSEDEMVEDGIEIEELSYTSEYVEVPTMVTYEVKGLLNKPEVIVKDFRGNVVDISDEDYADIQVTFESEEIDAELYAFVLDAAKTYSNYFSRDLEGCRASTKPIEHLFPKDSYYIQMAENYRKEDMWTFSTHTAPVFLNETVSDYTVYTDDCFSVAVSFDKQMYLIATAVTRVDHNAQIYYYVKIDGQWVIADIKMLND